MSDSTRKTVRDLIRVLLTPSCWTQLYRYSEQWDKILNDLMDRNSFEVHPIEQVAKLGTKTIWVANHPYASFRPYGTGPRVRPSRRTILKAWDKYLNDVLGDSDA